MGAVSQKQDAKSSPGLHMPAFRASRQADNDSAGASPQNDPETERSTQYEFIDSNELARRLAVPTSWVRDQVRSRSVDPLPHVSLGKYVRFLWGSPALEVWIRRRIVVGNNRRVERVP
jgi:hypothetical protein